MRTPSGVRRLCAATAAAALLCTGAVGLTGTAAADDVAFRSADGVFTFDGRGFGHGRGMSQYGAYGAALQGLDHVRILAHYYVGASVAPVLDTSRRVLVTAEDDDLVVTNVSGLVVRNLASGADVVAGDRTDWTVVRARPEGTIFRVEALERGAWVAIMPPVSGPVQFRNAPLQLHHPAGLRAYRGTLEAVRSGLDAKPLYVVNAVGLDDYVRGVVPVEMPSSWSRDALRAQAVAARSYGVQPCPQPTAYPATALYDVVDTTACQVYTGRGAEAAASNQAVTDTSLQVLYYGGRVLRAEFSAANGGWSVAATGPFVARADPYDAVGADAARRPDVHRWTGVRVPASNLESAFGTGFLREIRVLERDGHGEWGGRVLRIRLVGDTRTVEVTGAQLRSAGGLRSNWFTLVPSNPIDVKYAQLGGSAGFLGAPVGPEGAAEGGGRFRPYQAGAIYWSAASGAYEVHGGIRERWAAMDWERSPLGFPVTDELGTPDGLGRYNHFQGGSIYWTPATAAHEVRGAIRTTWSRLGWERSALGYPLTGELGTPDRVGRFNHFQTGSIYWTPATGAREVRGAIRERWSAMGWERSPLGYPVSDEYGVTGGRRGDFQRGFIVWDARTGATAVTLV